MRFHVLGLPFTQTNKDWCECAYTQKVLNFCKMMTARGHDVTHYGVEGASVEAVKVDVFTEAERVKWCGPRDKSALSNVDWNLHGKFWRTYNGKCIAELLPRVEPEDIICHITSASKAVADATADCRVNNVEYGIGYKGTFAKYRAFESYAEMHQCLQRQFPDPNGGNYDVVIPNFYDVADFPAGNGGDYLLFMGRIIQRKGLNIAVQVAKHLGVKLVIAGQGLQKLKDGVFASEDGAIYEYSGIDYVGHVNVQRRAKLMGNALAILVPTLYIEPFGGVNVEAQLCGTPAITQDWGGFVDTVEHGKSGFRCRTFDHWVWAAKNARYLNRDYIRWRAVRKYSLEKVGAMFEEWFTGINDIWRQGWNTIRADRTELDWLAA